jgi:NAD(P) transhydrogenase subunit beta
VSGAPFLLGAMSAGVDDGVRLAFILAAAGFVLGLHMMNSPATARRGNQLSAAGMTLALIAAVVEVSDGGTMTIGRWVVLVCGALIGGAAGLYAARSVVMTAMPQLVSLFNTVGGGAAALIAIADYARDTHASGQVATFTVLDVVIGAVTFAGSLLAAAKLQGYWTGSISFPGARALNAVLALAAIASGVAAAFPS